MPGGLVGRLRRRVARSGRGAGSGEPSTVAGGDGVVVSYAPDHDGDADPGEVVWAWVPYEEDATQGKDRPVLVIGYQDHLLAAVPLSSRSHHDRRDAADWIEVGRGAWDSGARVSYADASRLLRFIPSEVRREGAALDEDRFRQVVERVAAIHGWA